MSARPGLTATGFLRLVQVRIPELAPVIRFARRSPYRGAGMLDADEVTSAACLAYLVAAAAYDPARECSLPVFATLVLLSQVVRDLAKARSLRTTSIDRLAGHLRHREPDPAIAAWLEPLEYDDDEHAPEDPAPDPEEQLAAAERGALVRRLVAECRTLKPQERQVIRLRYLVRRPMTLRALGRRLGLTGERVRQIEAKALRKLRPGALALGLTTS